MSLEQGVYPLQPLRAVRLVRGVHNVKVYNLYNLPKIKNGGMVKHPSVLSALAVFILLYGLLFIYFIYMLYSITPFISFNQSSMLLRVSKSSEVPPFSISSVLK